MQTSQNATLDAGEMTVKESANMSIMADRNNNLHHQKNSYAYNISKVAAIH